MNKLRITKMAQGLIPMASIISAIVTFVLILGPTTPSRTQDAIAHAALDAPDERFENTPTVDTASMVSHRWDTTDPDPDPIPACEWTEAALQSLARMVQIESSNDLPPIAWTMARRWKAIGRHRGTSFADYVVETSRPLRIHARAVARGATSERELLASGLTPHQMLAVTDRLPDRDLVEIKLIEWASGNVADPCEGASFMWSAPSFSRSVRRVDCGDTSNHFYELPRVSHAAHVARLDDPIDACPVSGSSSARPIRDSGAVATAGH